MTDNEGNTYSSTTIPEKIVGLSGIDTIFIPNGWSGVSPIAPDTWPEQPQPADPTSIDHEELDWLLGGNNYGHYHLTVTELQKLKNMPDAGAAGEAATVAVDTVKTGAAGTSASVINVGTAHAAVLNFTIPKGDKGEKGEPGTTNHEELTDIQGGAESEHYHLDRWQHNIIKQLFSLVFPEDDSMPPNAIETAAKALRGE